MGERGGVVGKRAGVPALHGLFTKRPSGLEETATQAGIAETDFRVLTGFGFRRLDFGSEFWPGIGRSAKTSFDLLFSTTNAGESRVSASF